MSVNAQIYLELGAFFVGGLLAAIAINSLVLHFARSLGIRNKNDVEVRWSNESKPSLGGISLYIVFLFSGIAFAILYFENSLFHDKEYLGLLGAASLAFLMGMADDAYDTKPLLKLASQIACGLLLVFTGTTIDFTHIFFVDAIITVIWVVGLMNSLNMLDNMDGITSTVVVFILFTCLVSSFMTLKPNTNFWTIILITQIGAIIGFLKFNVNPSKMFMGDTGSQFLGLFVSFFSIKGLWNSASIMDIQMPSWTGFIITLTAFTPAAVDTLTVVINRLKKGQSPMIGGKDHTTHHLVYSGKNDKQVWYVFLVISGLASLISLALIYYVRLEQVCFVFVGLAYFLIVFFFLYRNTIRYKEPSKKK